MPMRTTSTPNVADTSAVRKRGAVDLRALQRFVANVPALRDALAAPMPSAHELVLRSEIRRTILALSDALQAAADDERNRTRAAAYLAASTVAAELAAGRLPARAAH